MTTQAAAPLPGVEQRLAGIESRLAVLEATMALFLEEQRQYREEQRAELRQIREEVRQYREEQRAELREYREENNARLGRVEANLTRIFFTIIGLMGTIIVGAIILRLLG